MGINAGCKLPFFSNKYLALALLGSALGSALVSSRAADISWTNTAGGNWSAAANWSPNVVPGSSDNANITNSGTYAITIDINATVARLLAGASGGTQTIALSSQTLTLNGASSLETNTIL